MSEETEGNVDSIIFTNHSSKVFRSDSSTTSLARQQPLAPKCRLTICVEKKGFRGWQTMFCPVGQLADGLEWTVFNGLTLSKS